MDLQTDEEYFYIAKEGLKAPLPEPWKPIQDRDGELYFYNFRTGEKITDHPWDEYYKQLFREEKLKNERKRHEEMIMEEQRQQEMMNFMKYGLCVWLFYIHRIAQEQEQEEEQMLAANQFAGQEMLPMNLMRATAQDMNAKLNDEIEQLY